MFFDALKPFYLKGLRAFYVFWSIYIAFKASSFCLPRVPLSARVSGHLPDRGRMEKRGGESTGAFPKSGGLKPTYLGHLRAPYPPALYL